MNVSISRLIKLTAVCGDGHRWETGDPTANKQKMWRPDFDLLGPWQASYLSILKSTQLDCIGVQFQSDENQKTHDKLNLPPMVCFNQSYHDL